ncbi:hypothetical protein JVU11DRAFT_10028 [Chiua virens]|nr:hypothetical protein JVU11DRAFT_10028 [Chiua virens]
MQVIDIPSSPEPSCSSMARHTRSASRQPGPSKKRPRLAHLAREPSVIEVIELSDSDNDVPAPSKTHVQPGPSQTTSGASVGFGKPNTEMLADNAASVSGSSQHAARPEQQGDRAPLFLPGSDDGHEVVVSVAQDIPDATLVDVHPLPEPPAPQLPAPIDPFDDHLVRVLEIVPDVQPAHASLLIEQFMQSQPVNVVEFVIHALFENPSYPKMDKKGKHKRDEPDDDSDRRGSPKLKVDYTRKDRVYNCGPGYFERSLEQLMTDFPRIPKPHIRSRLVDNRFYASTYLLLAEELKQEALPFKLKSTNSVVGKGKARQDPEFDKEREWMLLRIAELAGERDAALATSVNEQEYEDNGAGIECGCCFSEYPFDRMVQCPEAHLFCNSCMTSYASSLLGEHNPNIICMDQSGCKLPFPESELCRFLSSKLLELYYRVKQRKEIEAAGLENLEECPFCEYRCVIENEMEKLFRCENTECNAITCRMCKKPDHLPKTCKEADEDKHLDAQHIIEEAMTQALMRNCPNCQKSFIKEMGCNKMTCPNCRTVSCYICRKIIDGYEHFSNPPPYSGKSDPLKCNLWDPVEQRHDQEVSEAAKRALAELRKSRPDVDETSIKVDIPAARPARQAAGPAGANRVMGAPPAPVMRAGIGLAHQFAPLPAVPIPPARAGGVANPPRLAVPAARGRGRRAPPAAPAGAQAVIAAGGRGRRRGGR